MATFGQPLPKIETSIDKVPVTPMTDAQIADLRARVESVRKLDLPRLHDPADPHSRLFVMTLDGTQNDAIRDPEHSTNVGLIGKAIHGKADINVQGVYKPGVGNQPLLAGMVDSALGLTVEQQAQEAYEAFVEQANTWRRADPHAKISLAGVGFSRGATAILLASRMIHEKGVPDHDSPYRMIHVKNADGSLRSEKIYSRYLIPPGQIPQALILNDQVATGIAEDLDRRVPPSVVSVVQFKAEHEYRAEFPFYRADDPNHPDPRFHTVTFPGAHSNNGGGYLLNGISSQTLLANEIILNKFGAGIPESRPETDPKKYVIHDSEYLWNDRHADSPTPPLASRPARIVVNPQPEQVVSADTPASVKTSFREHLHGILSNLSPTQQTVFMDRMRDNFLTQEPLQIGASAER